MVRGRIGLTRPEHFLKKFNRYSVGSRTSQSGREMKEEEKPTGQLRCIFSAATPEERQQFNQMGVEVSHKLIEMGAPSAKEGDVLRLVKGGKEVRRFRIAAVHNKGEMDLHTVYYCRERSDLR